MAIRLVAFNLYMATEHAHLLRSPHLQAAIKLTCLYTLILHMTVLDDYSLSLHIVMSCLNL